MLLQATGICKGYGAHTILSTIWFQIQNGERVGLVGVNGAGKSTLMQILCGEISADSGEIHRAKGTKLGYLAQNSGLDSQQTIWHEMLTVFALLIDAEGEIRQLEASMADPKHDHNSIQYHQLLQRYDERSEWFRQNGGYEFEAKTKAVLHGMGFPESERETPVHTLSGGQKTRLALAKILLQEPDILMLDEPTNHLDIATLTWLENYLNAYPGAIVVISHDRFFLDAITQTIYEIERTQAKKYTGNYSKFIEVKALDAELQLKHYEKQQTEISQMEDFVQRNLARASTSKRAQSRRKALDSMTRLDTPAGELKRAHFSFNIERATGKDVLNVSNLAAAFEQNSPLFEHVSFQLKRGEVVALIGPNGVGKSTLFKTLIEQHEQLRGTIEWGANVQIGYYDQEQASLSPSNTVLDEVWNTYPHLEEARIRTVLGNFLFTGEDVLKKISALSGGEKARVSLAKLMLLNANVLILDEPTNHLDLYSKEVLEASLIDFEGTLLFISHDRYFLNKMAERIVELTPNGAHYFLGNYDDYVDKKQEIAEIKAELMTAQKQQDMSKISNHSKTIEPAQSYEAEKRAKQEERNRQRRSENLELEIAEIEVEISEIEAELTLPEVYGDYILIQEKTQLLENKRKQLHASYEEWEALMS